MELQAGGPDIQGHFHLLSECGRGKPKLETLSLIKKKKEKRKIFNREYF